MNKDNTIDLKDKEFDNALLIAAAKSGSGIGFKAPTSLRFSNVRKIPESESISTDGFHVKFVINKKKENR